MFQWKFCVMKLNLNIDKFNTQILRYTLSIYTVYYNTQSNDFVVYIFLHDENKYGIYWTHSHHIKIGYTSDFNKSRYFFHTYLFTLFLFFFIWMNIIWMDSAIRKQTIKVRKDLSIATMQLKSIKINGTCNKQWDFN